MCCKRLSGGSVLLMVLCLWAVSARAVAGSTNAVWRPVSQPPLHSSPADAWIQPRVFRGFHLDHTLFRNLLGRIPRESTPGARPMEVTLPMPDGSLARFRI